MLAIKISSFRSLDIFYRAPTRTGKPEKMGKHLQSGKSRGISSGRKKEETMILIQFCGYQGKKKDHT